MASKAEELYRWAPQMRQYDRLGVQAVPFLGFFNPPLYKSSCVNTDVRGFRAPLQGLDVNRDNEEVCVFGGSAVFGVGAASDADTLTACMEKKTGVACKNAGGRAFVSTQELLLGLYAVDLSRMKKIYLFSGLNDLVVSHLSRFWSPFGSQYFWRSSRSAISETCGPLRKLAAKILQLTFREDFDISICSLRDYISYRFGGMQLEQIRGLQFNLGLGRDIIHSESKDARLFSIIGRNLDLWLQTTSHLGAEIVYCLQPYLPWTCKILSEEEKELSRINHSRSGKRWLAAQVEMDDLKTYDWYRDGLRQQCESKGILFKDANRIFSDRSDWCFVDKIHMTGKGYELCADFLIGP